MEKKKAVLTSPLAGEDARRAGEGDIKEKSYFTPSSVCSDFARQTTSPARGEVKQLGFTLIELLVVVLIIGILAAVAVPQYQKAVEKSKSVQALTMLKNVYNAAKAYQLANGSWPTNFDELAVEIPWTGTTDGVGYGHHRHGKSNADWSIQILNSSTEGNAITVGRISGPYMGASFYIYDVPHYSQFAQDELLCIERAGTGNGVFHFTKSRGAYCAKIMKGIFVQTQSSGNWDTFKMP